MRHIDLRRSLVLLALAMTVAGTAAADSDSVVATLVQPIAAKKEIIIDSALFRCEGTTCVLASRSDGARSVSSCRTLQLKVGAVQSYVVGGKPFDADKLAKCNAHS